MLNWFTLIPLLALAAFGASFVLPIGMVTAAIAGLFLIAAVTASVHHAEVIASRVGEPFGTLVLALAITIIEVALIVSVMLAGGPEKAALPRDTIFAAIMLICTGVVGICMMVGGLSHREQRFQLDGAMAALAALITLAGVSLILPSFRPARRKERIRIPSWSWQLSLPSSCGRYSCLSRQYAIVTISCRR